MEGLIWHKTELATISIQSDSGLKKKTSDRSFDNYVPKPSLNGRECACACKMFEGMGI